MKNTKAKFSIVRYQQNTPKEFDELLEPQRASVEVNAIALPYAELNEAKARTSLGHEIIKLVNDGSKEVAWLWKVWPEPSLGMPTVLTLRVLFVLMQKANEMKEKTGQVPDIIEIGSFNGLCALIGLNPDRKSRALIRKHIELLIYTQCKSKGAFKTKTGKGLLMDKFSFLKRAGFVGGKDENGQLIERNFVVFEDAVRKNIESNYIKSIDMSFMRLLKTPIAQLLYTHLSHLFFEAKQRGWPYAEADYSWLAERMGLKVYVERRRARQQLKQAFEELLNLHYLVKVEWEAWRIRFYPGVRYEFGEDKPRQERKKYIDINRAAKPIAKSSDGVTANYAGAANDREAILAIQAAWILTGKKPDATKLAGSGWTVQDAYNKADELKQGDKSTMDSAS